ncbi:MAG: glycosyl hydrolase-related protein, partial [Fimbriimonas sp.]|nr:glycosyl hydrolase-related protein [Fimbriimonas sp.]
SDSGFELGEPRTFRYSIVPHTGDWTQAGVVQEGQSFNNPLLVRKAELHSGTLPSAWGLIETSAPNVVLSSLKPGVGNTLIVRVFESNGVATKGVKLRFHAQLRNAHDANLLEDKGKKLKIEQDEVVFDVHPFEIKTISVRLGRPAIAQ